MATNTDFLCCARHLLNAFTCIMSSKSIQETYDIATSVSPILQIRKRKPREVEVSTGSFVQTNDWGAETQLELH